MKYSLPDSASDLLIKDGKLLMRTLSVYEVLRRFGHILRLTSYRFEDFTAALLADDQSALLSEIHIQLLRTLVREDRLQQTWLGPPDIRDSVNLYLNMMDHSNWPAALDIYLSADPRRNAHILEIIDGDERGCYPFSSTLETRLFVLEDLCDRLLLTGLVRDDIVGGGTSADRHVDKNCRICAKANGDLTTCNVCLGNFHLKCSYPTSEMPPTADKDDPGREGSDSSEYGKNTHTCRICRDNHVSGVTDCVSEEERLGNLKRHEALGLDKLGRRYWFVIRRLFVVDETEDDVRYYTNVKQFREIMDSLNENRHDRGLIESLESQQEEIERQMRITEELYATLMKDHKQNDGTYALNLGQNGLHRSYTNNFPSIAANKLPSCDRDINRNLNNKFCMTSQLKWFGAIDGHLSTITVTLRTTILKFESQLPGTFVHPCWTAQRQAWIKSVNRAREPIELARALTKLETCIKPVLFKCAWYDSLGFLHLFRSTFMEREEMKKNDRQPRGFERNERTTADFELSYRLGTMVKFSPKLKPVKHQVWKQKGEEYRLTGLNGWYWHGITRRSRCLASPKLYRNDSYRWSRSTTNHPFVQDMMNERIQSADVIDISYDLKQEDEQQRILYLKIPKFSPFKRARINKMESLLQKKLDEIASRVKDAPADAPSQANGTGGDTSDAKPNINGTAPSTLTPIKTENGCTTMTRLTTTPNTNVKLLGIMNPETKKISIVNVTNKSTMIKPRLPPTHDFLTKRGKVRSIFVLPELELRRLARSGGQKEARTFSYTAKPNFYVWPYGITPRPTLRTCWLYRGELTRSFQEVSLLLKVMNACLRWDDLQTRAPASGHNVIALDDATVTIELLKKRDKLPYMTHSEYLIRKTTTPLEQPTKYKKIGTKKSTPSARSGLRARRQVEEEEDKKPTKEEIWVSECRLELWELKQFDEKLERQNALIRERAQREEADRRRRLEEEKRRASDQEKRRLKAQQEEANKRARLSHPILTYGISKTNSPSNPQAPVASRPSLNNSINIPAQATAPQQGSQTPTTPVLRYFRTEEGQIIRLPASYLQRGTPLILRHITPGTNQANTYFIKPDVWKPNVTLRLVAPTPIVMPTTQPAASSNLKLVTQAPAPGTFVATQQPQPVVAAVASATTQSSPAPSVCPSVVANVAPAPEPELKVEPTSEQVPPPTTELAPPPALEPRIEPMSERKPQPAAEPKLSFVLETQTEPQTEPTLGQAPLSAVERELPSALEPEVGPTPDQTTPATKDPKLDSSAPELEIESTPEQPHTLAVEPKPSLSPKPEVRTQPETNTVQSEPKRVVDVEPMLAEIENPEVAADRKDSEESGAETNRAVKSETSVGTVANEMAHDQHAPLANEASALPLANETCAPQIKVEGSAPAE